MYDLWPFSWRQLQDFTFTEMAYLPISDAKYQKSVGHISDNFQYIWVIFFFTGPTNYPNLGSNIIKYKISQFLLEEIGGLL